MKVEVRLDTLTDILEFVRAVTPVPVPVYLTSDGLKVSAKSLLGARYTLEWAEIWCECERDIYHLIDRFVV